jgi:hypothetical protein
MTSHELDSVTFAWQTAYIPVDRVKCSDLFIAAMLAEVVVKVFLPNLRRDTFSLVRAHIVLHVWQEAIEAA